MSHNNSDYEKQEASKDLLSVGAAIGIGVVASAFFPNPVTTPLVIAKCAYHLGRFVGGRD
jgi:uncharacterized protein (DUF2062 family)